MMRSSDILNPRAAVLTLALCACVTGLIPQTAATTGSAAPAQAPVASAGPWTAVAASGPVQAQGPKSAPEEWIKVTRGTSLVPLSVVRTGWRGRTTLARLGSVILVDSDSEVMLPEMQAGPGTTRVQQPSGAAVYEIRTTPGMRFEVETPYLVAGVKGTQFSVDVNAGYNAIGVDKGAVEVHVNASKKSFELRAGEMLVLDTVSGRTDVVPKGEALGHQKAPGENASQIAHARNEARRLARLAEKDARERGASEQAHDRLKGREDRLMERERKDMREKDRSRLDDLKEERQRQKDEDEQEEVTDPEGGTGTTPR